jgi:hypothetical protein
MIHSVKVEQIAPEILQDLLSDASGFSNQQSSELMDCRPVGVFELCLLLELMGVVFTIRCVNILDSFELCMRVGCECC